MNFTARVGRVVDIASVRPVVRQRRWPEVGFVGGLQTRQGSLSRDGTGACAMEGKMNDRLKISRNVLAAFTMAGAFVLSGARLGASGCSASNTCGGVCSCEGAGVCERHNPQEDWA